MNEYYCNPSSSFLIIILLYPLSTIRSFHRVQLNRGVRNLHCSNLRSYASSRIRCFALIKNCLRYRSRRILYGTESRFRLIHMTNRVEIRYLLYFSSIWNRPSGFISLRARVILSPSRVPSRASGFTIATVKKYHRACKARFFASLRLNPAV